MATAAALLQITWWFSHGWTWSNLAGFLISGQAVTWCVVLILLGASLSWLGLRRADYGAEGREWAAAGLAISALTTVPIMLGLLPDHHAPAPDRYACERPATQPSGPSDTDDGPCDGEPWPDNVTGATTR